MSKDQNNKFDLEDRTYEFAKKVREVTRRISKSTNNIDDIKQLIRSSGSVAANYIEANEALSKKDFLMRVKICRKESKESRLWIRLLNVQNDPELEALLQEATELMKIFGSIVTKSS